MWPKFVMLVCMLNLRNVGERIQCKNDPNSFCYLCSDYISPKKKKYAISSNVKKLVVKCFPDFEWPGLKSCWAPDFCCSKCHANLSRHCNEKAELIYSTPAVWRRPKPDHSDCYFCTSNLNKHNRTHDSSINLSTVSCITRPNFNKPERENSAVEPELAEPGLVEPDLPGPSNDAAVPLEEAGDFDLSFELLKNHDESFHTGRFHPI